ncbi:MAG: hypothetical protein AAGB27_02015 [Pseudomonadota bacterium]
MSDSIRTSAPGKLVLLGEYAVVYGAPALVAAVPRRARVTLEDRADARWHVSTPGFSDQLLTFDRHDDPRLGEALPLLRAALDLLAYRGPGLTITLDTEAFFAPQTGASGEALKLGIGSSAALCVSLVGALSKKSGIDRPSLDQALAVHRRFQGGRGSGIDVAASLYGGLIAFQLADPGKTPLVQPGAALPVHAVWLWSGASADTRSRLDRLQRLQNERPKAFAEAVKDLTTSCETAITAVTTNSAAEFLASVTEFTARLADLDEQAELGVWTAAHRRLAALAGSFGLLYKTSGAGGGDCGLALHSDVERLQAFQAAAQAEGFPSWDLAAEQAGLALE